jgi:hypothetical protein
MVVSRRRMLLGFLVLPVRMMVGRLQMMVCGGVMVRGGVMVMLGGRVFGLLCHGCVLPRGIRGRGRLARNEGPRSDIE